jgi:hypothetical protein
MWTAFTGADKKTHLSYIGNLHEMQQIKIEGMADVRLGKDGLTAWAFPDKERLVIQPPAIAQEDKDVRLRFVLAVCVGFVFGSRLAASVFVCVCVEAMLV